MMRDEGEIAIRVRDLGKFYRLGRMETYRTFRDAIVARVKGILRPRRVEIAREQDGGVWALRDLSLDVRRGEVVGIIGPNGAGKSTLLKVLSRVTEPTTGYAEVRGRVGSLLEVGTGFHPELTGRENIYLSAAVMGMRRAEVDRKFEQIVSFAEVAKFINTPVKRYSSGMYVRLAFSVAAHLEPDVLVVDEVLAVGDAAFQEKCIGRMADFSGGRRTVLFVSHNMHAVARLCERVVRLHEGSVVADGPANQVVREYLERVRGAGPVADSDVSLREHPGRRKPFDGIVRLTHCRVAAGDGSPVVTTGGDCRITLGYETPYPMSANRVNFVIGFRGQDGVRLASCWSQLSSDGLDELVTVGEVECYIRHVPLLPGSYVIDVGCQVASGWSDVVYEAGTVNVIPGRYYPSDRLPVGEWGQCLLEYEWSSAEGHVESRRTVRGDARA